jgi:DNA-binding transcriptional ArsR family regulator
MAQMPTTTPPITDRENVFRAVADPTRRRVLQLLAEGDLSAGELLSPFTISQPALSKHLRILREAGLVNERRSGRRRIYSIEASPLRAVHDWVSHYERFWLERLERFGAYLDRTQEEPATPLPRRASGRPKPGRA